MKTRLATNHHGDHELVYQCPGCEHRHYVRVSGERTAERPHVWAWNQSRELPTLSPSVNYTVEFVERPTYVCHSWIENGTIRFLADSTHALAGQSVELPDLTD